MNYSSLFIPRVFSNISKEFVAKHFSTIGHIERIDFVNKTNESNESYNSVYIHFNCFYDNEDAYIVFDDIQKHGKHEYFYDDKWYWIVLPNTSKYSNTTGKPRQLIDLGKDNCINTKNNIDQDQYDDEDELMMQEIEEAMCNDDEIYTRYLSEMEQEINMLRYQVQYLIHTKIGSV